MVIVITEWMMLSLGNTVQGYEGAGFLHDIKGGLLQGLRAHGDDNYSSRKTAT